MIEKFDPTQIPVFDLTKINVQQFRRASQSKADQPPSVNQKASMRKHFVEAEMILHMAKLTVKERVTGFIFGDKCYGTLQHSEHTQQSDRLDFLEYNALAGLLNKAGLNFDISHVAPTFLGKPFRLNMDMEYGVIVQFENGAVVEITPTCFDDAKQLIDDSQIPTITMFALFYFLDLKSLLDESRARGQSLYRFLKVYASPVLNELLFDKLEYFTRTMRLMTLHGVALPEITMEMLVRNVAKTMEMNQE